MRSNTARASEPRLNLDRFLPYRFSVLSNRVSDAIARHYSERFGLTIPEWRVMAVLGQGGDVSAREVAARTAMDKVRVSRAVTRLLQLGHITRRTDPKDRRRAIIDLTPSGMSVYRQIVPRALAVETEMLAALTDEERAGLEAMISKLESRVTGPRSTDDE